MTVLKLKNKDKRSRCTPIQTNTSLMGNFFNNALIQDYGLGPICRGLAAQVEEEIDLGIVDNLRSFLFQIPGAPPMGLDLAALNIQRGRDHGLPDYNTFRHYMLGHRAVSFSQITSNPNIQYQLQQAYNWDINNIDPWIGLLAEDHLPGTSVGPTMYAILQMQFQRLRDEIIIILRMTLIFQFQKNSKSDKLDFLKLLSEIQAFKICKRMRLEVIGASLLVTPTGMEMVTPTGMRMGMVTLKGMVTATATGMVTLTAMEMVTATGMEMVTPTAMEMVTPTATEMGMVEIAMEEIAPVLLKSPTYLHRTC